MNAKDAAFKVVKRVHTTLLRATGGRLLGRVAGMPMVTLTTTGRRTGQRRATPLSVPVVDGEQLVVVASYGGDSRHPAWYLNLMAEPQVLVDRGKGAQPMTARTASAAEKAELWPRIVSAYRGYAGYQQRTDRDIPVVILAPRQDADSSAE